MSNQEDFPTYGELGPITDEEAAFGVHLDNFLRTYQDWVEIDQFGTQRLDLTNTVDSHRAKSPIYKARVTKESGALVPNLDIHVENPGQPREPKKQYRFTYGEGYTLATEVLPVGKKNLTTPAFVQFKNGKVATGELMQRLREMAELQPTAKLEAELKQWKFMRFHRWLRGFRP